MATGTRTTNVDERVVQMTFNNAEFEKGVATTLSTLDKLKQALNFKAKTTGMEDLGRAVGLVEKNLQPMADDIDHIANRFSALGIIGDQVLRNLTNKVTAFGGTLIKSVTTEPLTSGFKEYETQMKSIQTILANTGMEGQLGVKKVNAALDELNKYADKTIYNFTQMTENIGRFTAAGVKLQPAVDAIKGTANLAALSGSTSEQASRAMYNLSQALSSGTLKLMDWNSVVNAGMGGTKFQDMLIRTAATMDGYGDRIEEWKAKNVDAFGSFRDSLSKGWITSDVLQNALHNFTYDVEEGTKEYQEALKELTDQGYAESEAQAILKIARQATEAAIKVRTFTQLIDTLKEVLGSGWSESWRLVFGDFNEATELWTGINDLLSTFIEQSSKARNEILKFWHDADEGGRAEFIDALKELVYDIALIVKPIKMAWDDVFGAFDKNKILEWTKAFKRFAESLHPSEEGFYAIHRIASSVFKILKAGFTIVGRFVSTAFKLGQPLLYLADGLLVAIGNIMDAIANSGALNWVMGVLEKIGNILNYGVLQGINLVGNGILRVSNAMNSLKFKHKMQNLGGFEGILRRIVDDIPLLSSAMKILGKITDGAKNGFDAFVRVIASGLIAIIDFVKHVSEIPILSTALNGISQIFKVIIASFITVGVVIKNIFTSIGNIDLTKIQNPFVFLKEVGMTIIGNIIGGFKALIQLLEEKVPLFKSFTGMLRSVFVAFKQGIINIREFFKTVKSNGGNLDGAKEGLSTFIQGLREFIKTVTPAKVAALAITGVMLAMSATFLRIGNAVAKSISSFNSVLDVIRQGIKGYVAKQNSQLLDAARALLAVASAIAIIAGIDPVALENAKITILEIIAVMGLVMIALEVIRNSNNAIGDSSTNIVNLGGIALMMLEMCASLAIMIDTLKRLQGFSLAGMEETLAKVMGIFATMMLIVLAFDRGNVGFGKGVLGILVLTGAVRLLIDSLLLLKEIQPEVILNALVGMVPLLATLAGIAFAAKGIGITTGLGIILTARAIESIVPQIKNLYNAMVSFPYWDSLMQYVEKYQEGFKIIGGFALFLVAIAGIFGKNLQGVGIGIAAMAGAMYIAVLALDKLTQVVQAEKIGLAMVAFAAIGALITWWLGLSALIPDKSAIIKVGVGIMLMASSLLVINLAIAQMAGLMGEDGIIGAVAIVAGLMFLIGQLMRVATDAASVKGVFGIIASIMVGLTVTIAEIIALSMMPAGDLVMPLITVGTIFFLISLIFAQLSDSTDFNTQAVVAMGIAIGGLVLIISSLFGLSKLPIYDILGASAAISLVMLAFSAVLKQITGMSTNVDQNAAYVVAALVAGIGVIAYSLYQLANFSWESLLSAAGGIALVLGAIDISIAILSAMGPRLSNVNDLWKPLLAFSGAVVLIAGSLAGLIYFSNGSDQILNAALGISVVLGVISALAIVFSKVNAAAIKGAFIGATAISVFILSLIGEMLLVYAAVQGINQLFNIDSFDVLRTLADELGSVVGSFVSGFSESASSSLPEVGKNLSDFATNAAAFFKVTQGINESGTNGIKNLASALIMMTSGGFLESLTAWITGESQIEKMETILPKLANGLIAYNDALAQAAKDGKNVDFSKIEESTNALDLIVALAKKIPNAGGAVGAIFGNNDAGDFGNRLLLLATGLRDYTETVNSISSYKGVEPSLNMLGLIVDKAKLIPNAGGIIGDMFGNNNVDDFGGRLKDLALGLKDYATITGSVTDWSKARSAIDVLGDIVTVAKKIPNGKDAGGAFNLASFFMGDNDIDTFGKKLEGLGNGLVTFETTVEDLDTDQIDKVSDTIDKLVTSLSNIASLNTESLYAKIPAMTGIIDRFSKSVVETLKTCSDALVKGIDELVSDTIKEGETENADFRKLGVEYAESIGSGIVATAGSIANDIKTLISNAFEKVRKELKETANEAGAEIGQEMVNGVVGPEGIDPDEHVAANDYSHKIVDGATTLMKNSAPQIYDNVKDVWDNNGSKLGDLIAEKASSFSVEGFTNLVSNAKDTLGKIASGEFNLTDYFTGGESGSSLWSKLGNNPLFKEFEEIFEGSDEEKGGFGSSLSDMADELKKATKSSTKGLSGTSSALKSAKDQLKEYNKYLKYSAKVEEEFAKTTGAAMSVFTNDTPINNAKVTVAALAEQIYSDNKKIQESIDDTATTAEDRAVEVMKAFNDDYESIKNSVGDSIDLFKNFYSEMSTVTKPSDILRNAQSQVDGYSQMVNKYMILATKGLPSDYIQELAEKGTGGLGEVNSLLAMSNNELSQYISLWEESRDMKDNIATQVMSARATAVAIKQLKEQAKGYKAIDKNLMSYFANYKKMAKGMVDNGGDPTKDATLVKVFEEINRLCKESNVSIMELSNSLEDSSASNAAAALELIEKYSKANEVIDKYNTTFSETEQSVRQLIEDQLGGFETFTKKTGISAEDMLDILKSQARGVNQWGKELASLASRGLSDEILKDLEKLGPEGYEKVHAFYKMTSEQIQKANELRGQRNAGTDRVSRIVATEFSNAAVGGLEAYKDALETASATDGEVKEIIEKFSTDVSSEITNQTSAQIIAGGKDIGKYLTDSIAEGVNNNKSTSTGAAKDAAKEATDGASDTLKEEGEKTINPTTKGIIEGASKVAANTIDDEGKNTINPAIDRVLDKARKKVDDGAKEIKDKLKDFMDGKDTSGIDENTTRITTTTPVVKKETSVPKNTSDILKNSGAMAKNYTKGIVNQFNDDTLIISKAAGNLADAATDTMTDKKHWDENSPSKTAKSISEYFMEGLIEGIVSVKDKLIATTEDVANTVSNKIGNVDINLRPIVHNEDGSYSTTETTFQEKWYGDEETGHYRIGHFATIRQDGTRLTDEELNDYIDTVLGSDDPFGVDAQMDNLLYMIADKISTGEYITDQNIEQAFQEASDWDKNMHELQDSMYRDKAMQFQTEGENIGNSFTTGVQKSLIEGITSMIVKLRDTITGSSEDTAITLVNMLRSAVEQAELMSGDEGLHPVITPVIDSDAAQNGFNVLGSMNGLMPLYGDLQPQATQIDLTNQQAATLAAIKANQYDDTNIVNELNGLRQDITTLNDKMGNLQVVMDSGAMVGAIAPKMDTELGTIYRRRNRG